MFTVMQHTCLYRSPETVSFVSQCILNRMALESGYLFKTAGFYNWMNKYIYILCLTYSIRKSNLINEVYMVVIHNIYSRVTPNQTVPVRMHDEDKDGLRRIVSLLI